MNKKRRNKQKTPIVDSIDALEIKAITYFDNKQYKQAIDIYKQLLKKEPHRKEWQSDLAEIYVLRAQILAKKQLYKEAIILWDNQVELYHGKKATSEQYIYWLIKAKEYKKIIALTASTEITETIKSKLWIYLSVSLFLDDSKLIKIIPQDAPVIKHYLIVKNVLVAYYKNDLVVAEQYVKQIPFRSLYRDFATVFKALLLNSETDKAQQLLKKVPKDSFYHRFAELITISNEQNLTVFLDKLSSLEYQEKVFIANLKSWNIEKIKAIFQLQTAYQKNNYKVLFETVVKNRTLFGKEYSRRFCWTLLSYDIKNIRSYEKIFNCKLSKFDKNRIYALYYEQQKDIEKVIYYWNVAIKNLKTTSNISDLDLKIALILRHIASTVGIMSDYATELLIESIKYDADDKASYINIINNYKKWQGPQKKYHKWADDSVKKFPQDGEILSLAMESAVKRKAFKKAVGYAEKLLTIDSINIKAREVAQNSHIAHARKLIKTSKYANASKELDQAKNYEYKKSRGLIEINQGLLNLQIEGLLENKTIRKNISPIKKLTRAKQKLKNSEALKLIQKGIQLTGDGLLAQFRLLMEAQLQQIDPKSLTNAIPFANYSISQQDFLNFTYLLDFYNESNAKFLQEAINQVNQPLKKAALELQFSKNNLLKICKNLLAIEYYSLIKLLANKALDEWDNEPIFVYYYLYSKVSGNIYLLDKDEIDQLLNAIETAEEQNDKATAIIIAQFLDNLRTFFNLGDMDEAEDDLFS
ncbi:MAG: tetratricopeptide repeat protein [Thiomargarita sp.]|nr:tetratricopeptide repeat protein [Thiomargarita sp.]